jgi:predicted glycosyltransferase
MRLMVYSHDTFGLGNIRRMLAICKHLLDTVPGLSVLLISGSPMLHSFRLPRGLDYIKLPCLGRSDRGELSAKYLGTETDEVLKLRSDLMLSAAANFKPDLLLVDKKPYGLKGELRGTLEYLTEEQPETQIVLLLRDILDSPEVTTHEWQEQGYYQAIASLYDQVLVVGTPEIFDVRAEYHFPLSVARKVQFCGYIQRELVDKGRETLRREWQVSPEEQLVLVTPGGGGDGYQLIDTYLKGLAQLPSDRIPRSVIVCGPEMPPLQRCAFYQASNAYPQVQIEEFTDNLIGYMDAADAVISMGGYNTVCEILSLGKRAIVIPRVHPVKEQWIRAERMSKLGWFQAIHPDRLTPGILMQHLQDQLQEIITEPLLSPALNLNALPRIAQLLTPIFYHKFRSLGHGSFKFQCITPTA